MTVKDIIDRVLLLYHDEQYIRVQKHQYLQLLDDAILQTILVRPDAHEKRETLQLKPGPRQELPDDAYALVDIYNNRIPLNINDPNDAMDGKPVYQVARKDLDYYSNWYSNPSSRSEIDEFAFDIRSPKKFWVNPPVPYDTKVYVEIGYSYQHTKYSNLDTDYESVLLLELEIPEEFRTALVSYMLYLLYSTDSTSEMDRQIAQDYLQTFYQTLGIVNKATFDNAPHIKEETHHGMNLHDKALRAGGTA